MFTLRSTYGRSAWRPTGLTREQEPRLANNLYVSYDLYLPGQNYDGVIAKIKELGSWAKIHKYFWYVNSPYTSSQAAAHVWSAMDARDKVYVVDATNNEAAWYSLSEEVSQYIQDQWYK